MDGNYNAENIYFDEDFIFTKDLGVVVIPESGNIKVDAAGKNLKEFLTNLFAKEEDPFIVENVGASLTLQSAKEVEVGTEYTPNYVVNFYPGKYSYGPDTNIVASYNITDNNGNESAVASGKFEAFTIGDDTNYQIKAVISYSEGSIPLSNLGNAIEEKRIKAGSIELNSDSVKGYRNAFYGTLSEKKELTSDIIRSLTATNGSVAAGTTLSINIPIGTKRVVVAYDNEIQDLKSVLDKNDAESNIVSGFGNPQIIPVKGANDYQAIDYKVYVMDFANPYDTENIFTITI